MLLVYGSKHSLLPRICDVDAVGIGATSSELRTWARTLGLLVAVNKSCARLDAAPMHSCATILYVQDRCVTSATQQAQQWQKNNRPYGRCSKERVAAHPVLRDAAPQRGPVVSATLQADAPHVRLHDALAHRAALVARIRAVSRRELVRRAQRRKVNRLEDVPAHAAHARVSSSQP
jgi:hypothetical protein